jgi:hypothetical protein
MARRPRVTDPSASVARPKRSRVTEVSGPTPPATPERSTISREPTLAFSKRQRTGAEPGDDDEATDAAPRAATADADAETKPVAAATDAAKEVAAPSKEQPAPSEEQPAPSKEQPAPSKELPAIEPPRPTAEAWPDATPQPMKPVERARTETVAIPTDVALGRPPAMPRTVAPPPVAFGTVEDPTHMPGPREIPSGHPDDPAPAPGRVPPGDSRSMRHQDNFALIYRLGTVVISRVGRVGTRGQWRVVEYPTSASASHSYAKECSRFVSEGFSDYRE